MLWLFVAAVVAAVVAVVAVAAIVAPVTVPVDVAVEVENGQTIMIRKIWGSRQQQRQQ